jgi:hypothetical protein
MNLKRIILFSIFVALIAFAGVSYWELTKPVPDPVTSFQHQMLAKGYIRDHTTHRWYSIWESADNNGCVEYGTPLETTFNCRTPLSGGIPDQK